MKTVTVVSQLKLQQSPGHKYTSVQFNRESQYVLQCCQTLPQQQRWQGQPNLAEGDQERTRSQMSRHLVLRFFTSGLSRSVSVLHTMVSTKFLAYDNVVVEATERDANRRRQHGTTTGKTFRLDGQQLAVRRCRSSVSLTMLRGHPQGLARWSRVARWRRHVPRDWWAYGEEMQRELRQDFCLSNSERRGQLTHKAGPS